jgi:hypothetical protein
MLCFYEYIKVKVKVNMILEQATKALRAGMSNMRPFASTPAARTKDTLTAKVAVFII